MAARPEWGEKTSALQVASVLAEHIKEQSVVITGVAPNGLGESTAVAVASQGPSTLIFASRTPERMQAVADKIKQNQPHVNIQTVVLDLASQDSIRKAGVEIARLVPKVDVLINNAGIFVMKERNSTKEGIEIQFGANHIGHFLFTKTLMPLLLAAAKGSPPGATRIVNVTSQGHRLSPVRFHDYNQEKKPIPPEEEPYSPLPPAFARTHTDGYNPIIAYAQCKTANILFSLHLQNLFKDRGITSYAVHPGSIPTDFGRNADEEHLAAIAKGVNYWKTLDEGSSTTITAAFDPKLTEVNGHYMSDCNIAKPADHAANPAAAERLWKLSEELIGEEFRLAE